MQKMCVDCSINPGGHPIFLNEDDYTAHRAKAHGEPAPAKPGKPDNPPGKPAAVVEPAAAPAAAAEAGPLDLDVKQFAKNVDAILRNALDRVAMVEAGRQDDAETLDKLARQVTGLSDTLGSLIARAPYAAAAEVSAIQQFLTDVAGRLTALETKTGGQ